VPTFAQKQYRSNELLNIGNFVRAVAFKNAKKMLNNPKGIDKWHF
jgi:hypothetical protein